MGLLRYVLASLVVIFHLSGIDMFAGGRAVMGFYVVSGYLIAQVIDTRYGVEHTVEPVRSTPHPQLELP